MLRSAPYTLKEVGGDLPRPATKVRRAEVSAGLDCPRPEVKKIGQLPPLSCAQPAFHAATPADVEPIMPSASPPACILAAAESDERKRLATVWLGFADVVRRDSKLFIGVGPYETARLLPLFLDRAPATLRRHLSGWRAWLGRHNRPRPPPLQDSAWRAFSVKVCGLQVPSGATSECA